MFAYSCLPPTQRQCQCLCASALLLCVVAPESWCAMAVALSVAICRVWDALRFLNLGLGVVDGHLRPSLSDLAYRKCAWSAARRQVVTAALEDVLLNIPRHADSQRWMEQPVLARSSACIRDAKMHAKMISGRRETSHHPHTGAAGSGGCALCPES